ncbi:MAG: hypothetical protein HY062_17315 [Bacteroidetes bacterium]|nr:hypothetical protein [Bacteroidota bacterium]
MRKFSILTFLSLTSVAIQSQNYEIDRIKEQIKSEIIKAEQDTDLLTTKAINLFFAKRVANYLSGSQELSLFTNYASISTENDRLSIGQNINLPKDSGRIRHSISIAFEANIKEKWASLYETKDWSKEMGINLKYTYIGGGSINYKTKDQTRQQYQKTTRDSLTKQTTILTDQFSYMIDKRKIIDASINSKLTKEWDDFTKEITALQDTATIRKLKEKKLSKLSKTYKDEFAKQEEEAVEDQEDFRTYNRSRVWWWSFGAFVPVSDKKYTVADSFSINSHAKYLYPLEVFTKINQLQEIKNSRLFFNIGYKGFLSNSIKSEVTKGYDVNTYKALSTSNDTSIVSTLETNKVYVGSFESYFTSIVKAQLIWFNKKWDYIGVDIFCEKYFGKYDPINAGIGLPINLKGKGDDTKVNFELVFKATDLSNTIQPTKTFDEKFTIGFSVALPFGSIIY